jgi:hypothetical protein
MQLYSEKIIVTCESESENEPSKPISFKWRNEEFRIEKIQKSWQDWGFPAGAPRKKNWRLRRHRNYFRVRTDGGRIFEIYMDRKTPRPAWVLYRELDK